MKNNFKTDNSTKKDLIHESTITLDAVMSTIKTITKALKKIAGPGIKDHNALNNDLRYMTSLYNDICSDAENLVKFLAIIGNVSEDYADEAFSAINNKRNVYLDYKRSQPAYIKKLMA